MIHTILLAILSMSPLAPPTPLAPVPSERQVAWHDRSMYAFVHFNMNTFTDHEWGDGRESPATFNPTALDTDQWCKVFKDAGLTGVIITAKHHDGFCLWPTQTTGHTVAQSPWRNGKGDLLRELSTSCKTYGLDFGVYLSPWDRNHPLYGTGEKYNDTFVAQLQETLGSYGDVFEVWFDGACGEGPNGKRQVYDFDRFNETVRALQPNACIFSDAGPDVRWIGNERGFAGATNWNMLRRNEFYPGIPGKTDALNRGQEDGTHWLPGECDVSIRPGWYYHASQDDKVKDLKHLLRIWYGSVGSNANLLLNFPVDRRGLVHEHDAAAVMELHNAINAITKDDLARTQNVTATNARGNEQVFAPDRAVDGDPATYWATDDGVVSGAIEVSFDHPQRINHVDLGEYLPLGQRVKKFTVEAFVDGGWRDVAHGTTIGNRRILPFKGVDTDRVRVTIHDARGPLTLRHFRLYNAPKQFEPTS